MKKVLTNYKLLIGIFLAFLLYTFYDKLFSTKKSGIINEEEMSNEFNNTLTVSSELSQTELIMICNQLETAFSYSNFFEGTDEDGVFSALDSNYSILAREQIYATYGFRPYNGYSTPDGIPFEQVDNLDLSGWSRAELSGDDLQYVIDYFLPTKYTI
jgi:hypothetical protein